MILGTLFIIGGLVLLILNKHLVKIYFSWQKQNFNLKFGPNAYKFSYALNIIGGVLFITLGVLTLTGVIEQR